MVWIQLVGDLLSALLGVFIVLVLLRPFFFPKPKYAVGTEVVVTSGKYKGLEGYIYGAVGRQYGIGGKATLVWVSMKRVKPLALA